MSSLAAFAPWLTLGLTLLLAAIAVAVLGARSLFVMLIGIAAMAALAAAIALALGGGDGALALAAFGVGLAPIWMMAALLLSARTVKPARRGLSALVLAAAVAGALGAALMAPELESTPAMQVEAPAAPGLWLAGLVFVAAIGAVALLGYGERGALQAPRDEVSS